MSGIRTNTAQRSFTPRYKPIAKSHPSKIHGSSVSPKAVIDEVVKGAEVEAKLLQTEVELYTVSEELYKSDASNRMLQKRLDLALHQQGILEKQCQLTEEECVLVGGACCKICGFAVLFFVAN
jgi:hypothetical protein